MCSGVFLTPLIRLTNSRAESDNLTRFHDSGSIQGDDYQRDPNLFSSTLVSLVVDVQDCASAIRAPRFHLPAFDGVISGQRDYADDEFRR